MLSLQSNSTDMKHSDRFLVILSLLLATCCSCPAQEKHKALNVRLLYWNIQNGMWCGQGDGYDAFVKWVKEQDPDICVWCEAQSIYKTNTADPMPSEARYLTEHWSELAARYGHKYVYIGGQRDNYPQAITSKYPIENVARIIGNGKDSIVSHGCGWAKVVIDGEPVNIVTLHTWPQGYAFGAEDKAASKAEHGGDRYRRMEIEYICRHTILGVPEAANQMWMMMGDFNTISSKDDFHYALPADDSRFLVHDYILGNTPYLDVYSEKHPGEFHTSTYGDRRIDFVYATSPLLARVSSVGIILDDYTKPVRDPQNLSNFWWPSDHLPIMVDFDFSESCRTSSQCSYKQ